MAFNWDELAKALEGPEAIPPPNSFTSTDYAKQFKIRQGSAQARLKQAVEQGILVRTSVKAGKQHVYYYTWKETKK